VHTITMMGKLQLSCHIIPTETRKKTKGYEENIVTLINNKKRFFKRILLFSVQAKMNILNCCFLIPLCIIVNCFLNNK